MKLTVDKRLVDKGLRIWEGPDRVKLSSPHASVVQSAEVLMGGTDAWTQVASDRARARGGGSSPKDVGPQSVEEGGKDKERANRVAQQVLQSANKVFQVCSQPPRLHALRTQRWAASLSELFANHIRAVLFSSVTATCLPVAGLSRRGLNPAASEQRRGHAGPGDRPC